MSDFNSETEADPHANRIDPVLVAAGWLPPDAHIKREQIAPGRIVQGGKRANPMSADYLLHYRDQKLAVIEAKRVGIATPKGCNKPRNTPNALREGIEDSYLTPFRVRQYSSTIDTYTFEGEGEDEVVAGEVADGTTFEE